MSDTRWCSYCHENHPLVKQFWSRLKLRPNCPTCRKQVNDTRAIWHSNNSDYMRTKQKETYERHKSRIIRRNYEYARTRKLRDVEYKLACLIRTRINQAVRGKNKAGSSVKNLGCSMSEFKQYIQEQFRDGMTWKTMESIGI